MPSAPTVLCLGNFDGVHRGHRELIRRAHDMAKKLRPIYPTIRVGIFCFSVPPRSYLYADPPSEISSLREKIDRFTQCGVQDIFLGDFRVLHDCPYERFIREVLVEQCHCVATVCGFNFHFGRRGEGNEAHLRAFFGQNAETVPAVCDLGDVISSTRIREMLEAGRVEEASILLGDPFCLTAPVVHGRAVGRTIGFPTANQFFPRRHVVPAFGIYATRVKVDDRIYRGVTNIGIRPTLRDGRGITCETHLLDSNETLYNKVITTYFCAKLRDEMRFENLSALQKAIAGDCAAAYRYFETHKGGQG